MSILVAFQHTGALPASWLSLREVLRLVGASASMRTLVVASKEPWEAMADRLRRAQPRAWLSMQCALAGVARRRNASGSLLRLRATERRRLRALPTSVVVAAHAARVNAPLVVHEHAFRFDAVGKASSYPSALCRSCSSFTRTVVWGGRCVPCFQRDDVEVSAGDLGCLGLRKLEHRRGIPYRAVYRSGVLHKRYSLRALHAGLPMVLAIPSLGSRRHATVRAARRLSFAEFRRHVRSRLD